MKLNLMALPQTPPHAIYYSNMEIFATKFEVDISFWTAMDRNKKVSLIF